MLVAMRTALTLLLLATPALADDLRLITTGWNKPTARQFARDAASNGGVPADGTALAVRAKGGSNSNPFRNAHAAEDWGGVDFAPAVNALAGAGNRGRWQTAYVVLNANPGDVDWLDDAGWAQVVDHWRAAARVAKAGRLSGLLFDPEPYKKPFAQFDYAKQPRAAGHPFADYEAAARRRGREVMRAVAAECPDCELLSYFWNSYLVRDHRYRGPTPVGDDDDLKPDAKHCLAGHSYGLLPAFFDGMLSEAPGTVRFVDGCENAYWFTERPQFFAHAADVRTRGRALVSPENRGKYDAQVRVGMAVFLDAYHPDLVGKWTLKPEESDRLGLLRRNVRDAFEAGDGLVWLYNEHGRWWPKPGESAEWRKKEVYPLWEEVLPGVTDALAAAREEVGSLPKPTAEEVAAVHAEPPSADLAGRGGLKWQSWVRPETGGTVELTEGGAVLAGCTDAAAIVRVSAEPGETVAVRTEVRQTGRGLPVVALRWRDAENKWLAGPSIPGRAITSVGYAEAGDPAEWRAVRVRGTCPEGAAFAVATLGVESQFEEGRAEYRGVSFRAGRE